MKKFRMTKLAAAIGAATMSLALAPSANAVVVVGGDNGWEVSFDGNVNAFYSHISQDDLKTTTTTAGGASATTVTSAGVDASRVHSGFLPAFFSFNVKSPTVNGLTGTGRFSFAPTINTGQNSNGLSTSGGLTGATIDTREVLANVEGSFGTVSFGRTLSIYGRQAILHDMTLFGVGNNTNNPNFGSVTAGRIGIGYLYPDFEARFAYATPNINGFKAEVGAYDPTLPTGLVAGSKALGETTTPRFEGELSYATTFTGGDFLAWFDGMWQSVDNVGGTTNNIDMTGWGGGAQIGYMGFAATGYYQQNRGTSLLFKGVQTGFGGSHILGTEFNCRSGTSCSESDINEWYVQGTYTFNGKTKVGISYGEGNQDGTASNAAATNNVFDKVENSMWSVGVYHDLTPWLKLIGEYNNIDQKSSSDTRLAGGNLVKLDGGYDSFSVGAFLTW